MKQKFFRKTFLESSKVEPEIISAINKLQTNIEQAVSDVIKLPILSGNMLDNITLEAAAYTTIAHKLNKKPQGYIVVSSSNNVTFKDNVLVAVGGNVADTQFVKIYASAATTVKIWIF